MKPYLHPSQPVTEALATGQPVVALESTVIAHGLPYPSNLETALRMEEIIREQGAVPATIAVIDGRLRVGLEGDELEYLASTKGIRKASRRDLPIIVAEAKDGATTVATTATIAAWAGIEVFATGGIGGVHRTPPFDISNDLPTIASTPVAIVCAGAKAILDLRATLEWLETAGVPVVGYGIDQFPAFYARRSGLPVDTCVDTPAEAAAIIQAGRRLELPGGVLITVPVPAEHELPAHVLETATDAALTEAQARGIDRSAATPFLLNWIARHTGGASLKANIALLENNAAVAGQIAVALKALS
jgi:pseudouridine-5'-phosphate glycosidase